MRMPGLSAGRPGKRKPHTTDSWHTQPVAPNLQGRSFRAAAPNRKWVAHITGVSTRGGWRYLAGILAV
jgi:transposase InsO family protein